MSPSSCSHKALPLLKEQGIAATLVDLYSLPFDDVAILELVQTNHGQVLTVEDNCGAGMGSAVADALALHGGSYTLMQMYVCQSPILEAAGARVQRPLWASTSTKNPLYHDTRYAEPLVGPHTVNTMPAEIIALLADHGKVVAQTIEALQEETCPRKRMLPAIEKTGKMRLTVQHSTVP
jgi:transaldolase